MEVCLCSLSCSLFDVVCLVPCLLLFVSFLVCCCSSCSLFVGYVLGCVGTDSYRPSVEEAVQGYIPSCRVGQRELSSRSYCANQKLILA